MDLESISQPVLSRSRTPSSRIVLPSPPSNMKTVILIALVASCFAAPAPRADYAAVSEKVAELQELVRSSLLSVVTIASAEDADIGANIAIIAGASADRAKAILEQAQAFINDETLTLEQAQAYLQDLEALLLKTQADCREFIEKLIPNTQALIKSIFDQAYARAQGIAAEIYALLAPRKPLAVDYALVSQKVAEVQDLVREGFETIVTAAKDDNAVAGGSIEEIAAGALDKARTILAEAQVYIDAQTLSIPQAQGYFKQLEELLLKTQADCQPHVDQLSQAVQDAIKDTFASSYMKAQELAQEIYVILAGN